MTRTVCRIIGFALMGTGFIGFFQPHFLGMHLTPVHDVIHMVSGGLALFFGYAASQGSKGFTLTFGAIYLLLGVLGFAAPNLVARLIGHATGVNAEILLPDNLVHLLVGGFLLGTGWASAEYPTHPRLGIRA
jgi:hypothetical protein